MNLIPRQNLDPANAVEKKSFLRRFGFGCWTAIKVLPHFLAAIFLILLGGAVLLAISFLPYYQSLQSAYRSALTAETTLREVEPLVLNKDFADAGDKLRLAEAALTATRENLKIVKRAPIFFSVTLRQQLGVAEDLITIGADLSGAFAALSDLGLTVTDILRAEHLSFADIGAEKKAEILGLVADSLDELKELRAQFSELDDRLAGITARQPWPIFDFALDPLRQKIPKLEKAFNGVVTVAELSPIFSGYPEEKTYLLLLLNNRELRPGGGFIGTYGILKIKHGELVEFFTDDIYNLDKPAKTHLRVDPPAPIREYLRQEQWFLRDSNWWSDFPTSAKQAMWFYREEGGREELDGVLAFTPTVMEELLGVLGEYEVSGTVFNRDNFWERLEYQVEQAYHHQGLDEGERKDIIGELGQKLIKDLHSLPMNRWLELFDLAEKLAREKQVMMYLPEAKYEALVAAQKWSGAIENFRGDYLHLVDANMASLKTDEVMTRELHYSLSKEGADWVAEARAKYINHGEGHTWKNSRYRNYARFYAPAGSRLLSVSVGREDIATEQVTVYEEFGKTAWDAFVVIEPGQSQEVIWRYVLPATFAEELADGEYDLLVQKQPGLPALGLTLHLDFGAGQVITHREELRADQVFQVWLKD